MMRNPLPWLGLFLLSAGVSLAGDGPKVPVALAWGPGERLYVALREARSVAVVDPKTWRVVAEWNVKARLASIALADDHATFLLGGQDGEFLVLDSNGRVVRQMALGTGPARVVALPDGRAVVGTRWDAKVRLVDWARGTILAEHALPFAPGAIVRRPDGRVVVADAFGGRIADLKPGEAGSERVRTLDGVNLQALLLSGDGKELLIAHVAQYDTVPVTRSNIDWGLVLSSRLSAVRLADLDRDQGPDATLPRRRITLDGSNHGEADPSALAQTAGGFKVVIALSGAHQLLLDDRTLGVSSPNANDLLPLGHNQRLEVVEVGRSPVDVVLDPSGTHAVTADAMSDTLSVVRLDSMEVVETVALSPSRPSRTAAQRGEALFLDGRRALDRWMSCASCHNSGHTNGLNFDTLGDGDYGAAKSTPSLLGVGPTAPFAWTGKFPSLAEQIRQSLSTSLHGPQPDAKIVDDLTAYLNSLPPPPAKRPADDPAARRGARVFEARRCDSCHRPPLYTSASVRDVGLDDGAGRQRYNPPSLRGIAWSAPYFHDGRADNLAEVLEIHSPGQPEPFAPGERDDLIAFLESL